MKDRKIEKLIENIEDINELDFDFNNCCENLQLDDETINKIKSKTYEKIGKTKIKKYKMRKLIASISLIAILGSSAVLAMVNNQYKYDPSTGKIIKAQYELYVLKESITKEVYDGQITLTSVVVDTDAKGIVLEEEAVNVDYKYIKRELTVNDEIIMKDDKYQTYEEGFGKDWSTSIGTEGDYEYQKGDKIVYSILLKDESNKVTRVDFDIDLVKATSIEQYNKNLPNDTDQNVTISAITREEDNILYIDLLGIPSVDNFDFTVDSYGNYTVVNNRTGVFLTDNNGEERELEPTQEDTSGTTFKVDISNLEKPFVLSIDKVNVSVSDLKTVKVTLPELEVDKRQTLNKVIDITDENNLITSGSSKVLIKTVKRTQSDDVENYSMNIDYPDNDNSAIKLRGLNIDTNITLFGFSKNNMSFAGQLSSTDDYIYSQTDIEYPISNKKYRQVSFKIGGREYYIDGDWKLEID